MINSAIWNAIDYRDKKLYGEICAMMEIIPDDIELGDDCGAVRISSSSHIVARAFAKAFPEVRCSDGFFAGQYPHSWLVTERFSLIDVFPCHAVGQPILLSRHHECPGLASWYQESPGVMYSIYNRIGRQEFDRAVRILSDIIVSLH